MQRKTVKYDIKVVQMDKHFLYLPFYYAKKHNFFGYLPKNYNISIADLPKFGHTDENAFKALMEERNSGNEINLAICDPIVVFNEKYTSNQCAPAIIAGLITNSAFWAIDHHTHKTVRFKDLGAYDKIITYPTGTTSYTIAERLYKVAGKTCPKEDFIKQVDPNLEILMLNQSQSGTIALSPNPFDIADLVDNGNGKFKINLALGDTPEYENVLVTALLSKRDFVNKHPDFIHGMVKALQKSVLLIRHYDETRDTANNLLKFTEEYFPEGKNAAAAIKMALQSRVFPNNLEITRGQWIKAIRANHFDLTEDESDEKATKAYEMYIAPFSHFSQEAARSVIAENISLTASVESNIYLNKINYTLVSGIMVLYFLCIAAFGFKTTLPIPIGTLLGYTIFFGYKFYEDRKRVPIHIFIIAALVGYSLYLLNFSGPPLAVSVSVIAALCGWEIQTINASNKPQK